MDIRATDELKALSAQVVVLQMGISPRDAVCVAGAVREALQRPCPAPIRVIYEEFLHSLAGNLKQLGCVHLGQMVEGNHGNNL